MIPATLDHNLLYSAVDLTHKSHCYNRKKKRVYLRELWSYLQSLFPVQLGLIKLFSERLIRHQNTQQMSR